MMRLVVVKSGHNAGGANSASWSRVRFLLLCLLFLLFSESSSSVNNPVATGKSPGRLWGKGERKGCRWTTGVQLFSAAHLSSQNSLFADWGHNKDNKESTAESSTGKQLDTISLQREYIDDIAATEDSEFSGLDTLYDLPTQHSEEALVQEVLSESSSITEESFTSLDTFGDVPVTLGDPVSSLLAKYRHRLVLVDAPQYPHCEIFLCGTLHVSEASVTMVQEAMHTLCPHFAILELCDTRLEGLLEDEEQHNITLSQVIKTALHDRSIKTFGIGLLTWMQVKAAKTMGSKLGGELSIAAKEAHRLKSRLILGDRNYAVTIQRIFDRLTFVEKMKMIFVMTWETLTMSLFRLKDYIHKSQQDDSFIADELERFSSYLPNFAEVVIKERDEYLAQTIHEVASVGFGRISTLEVVSSSSPKGRILAIVGAGHLPGIQRHLQTGGIALARMQEISSSSKHACTWPGSGVLQVVDTYMLFNQSLSLEMSS